MIRSFHTTTALIPPCVHRDCLHTEWTWMSTSCRITCLDPAAIWNGQLKTAAPLPLGDSHRPGHLAASVGCASTQHTFIRSFLSRLTGFDCHYCLSRIVAAGNAGFLARNSLYLLLCAMAMSDQQRPHGCCSVRHQFITVAHQSCLLKRRTNGSEGAEARERRKSDVVQGHMMIMGMVMG